MLTYSRGALLAALGAYLGLWAVTRDAGRDWKTPMTFAALAGVVLALTVFSAPLFVERSSTVSPESPSLQNTGRISIPCGNAPVSWTK